MRKVGGDSDHNILGVVIVGLACCIDDEGIFGACAAVGEVGVVGLEGSCIGGTVGVRLASGNCTIFEVVSAGLFCNR